MMNNVHSDYYERLNIDYDSNKLIEESIMVHYSPFQTGKKTDTWFDNQETWYVGRVNDSRMYLEVHRLKKMIETLIESKDVRPRYYAQIKGSSVPFHSDMNTECAINIILSNRAGPVLFEDIGEVVYRCALLNTTQRHGVPEFKTERLLLKFSIFDRTYQEVRERLKEHGYCAD
jgi:hypothetical protein